MTFTGNYNANPKLSADEKTLVMIHRQDGYKVFGWQQVQRSELHFLHTSLMSHPLLRPTEAW